MASNIFSQLDAIARIEKPKTQVSISTRVDPNSLLAGKMKDLKLVFTATGLNELASKGVDLLIDRALERLVNPGVGPLRLEGHQVSGFLEQYVPKIRGLIKDSKRKIEAGKWAFASVSKLDSLVITHKFSESPYNIVWQIIEFGTGQFAEPRRRLPGDPTDMGTKVPGGSGAWYLSPKHKGPIILGQEGTGFLFGARVNAEHVHKDIDEVLKLLAIEVQKDLQRILA